MYINKCTKCGAEFETKNPKRVICPNCLYPDRKASADTEQRIEEPAVKGTISSDEIKTEYPQGYSSASFGGDNENSGRTRYSYGERPQRSYGERPASRSYGDRPQRNYNDRPQRNYNERSRSFEDRPSRGYGDRPQRNYTDRPQRSFNRNNYGNNGYNKNNNRRGGFNKRSANKPKQLLVTKEQLEQIEFIYKKALPLPNHDIHEVIGSALGIEPRKVFFGINLIRQKMMLPKLSFPKRKLAVTPDQLTAIKMFYEPLLPVPPIGCHKLIAAQLKMDEWRVHVGIGLIRKQMGLDRWNSDRPDAPKEFKK